MAEPSIADLTGHLTLQAGGTLQVFAFLAIAVIGLAAPLRLLRTSRGAPMAWPAFMVLAWFVLPAALAFAGSYITPVFVSRYLIVSLPALALLVALGLSELEPRKLSYGLTGLLVLLALPALDRVYFDTPKEDWRGATSLVLAQARPGDAIVFHSPWVEGPYSYYAANSPAEDTQPVVAYYDAAAEEVLGERLRGMGHDRVWLVLSHAAFSAIPEIAETRVNLENSLGDAYELASDQEFHGPIQVRLYD